MTVVLIMVSDARSRSWCCREVEPNLIVKCAAIHRSHAAQCVSLKVPVHTPLYWNYYVQDVCWYDRVMEQLWAGFLLV